DSVLLRERLDASAIDILSWLDGGTQQSGGIEMLGGTSMSHPSFRDPRNICRGNYSNARY
ncbi:MAG: hypothetical protein WDZ51_08915, partial [Pirellulaceae bacterium]